MIINTAYHCHYSRLQQSTLFTTLISWKGKPIDTMNCETTATSETDSDRGLLEKEALENAPLAFSSESSSSLVPATSRLGVPASLHQKRIWMNVEIFESNTSTASPLVIFIPGICESAETKTVQEMASWAKNIGVRLAVLELPGHGLSSGNLAEMPTNIYILIKLVLAAIDRILKLQFETDKKIPYLLSGSSFGGTLSLYAAEYISRRLEKDEKSLPDIVDPQESSILKDEELWEDFFSHGKLSGVVSVTPAVGVDHRVLPPDWIVSTLSVASAIFPAAQLPFTPLEDSSQYDCPSTSTRNFKGRWPLAISKFLLDLTTLTLPEDVAQGRLTLKNVPRVILMAGSKDHMIPIETIHAVEAKIAAPNKEVVVLPKVGHDLLINPKSSSKALEILFGSML